MAPARVSTRVDGGPPVCDPISIELGDVASVGSAVKEGDTSPVGEEAGVAGTALGLSDAAIDAVGRGETVGEGDGIVVGVGETQRGSTVKRTTRCSTYPSACVTRQNIEYEPGARVGTLLR